LARRPELLIMDEPLAGLDAASAEGLVDTLRRLDHLTCLVVLHEPGPFASHLRRGIVLEGGRVAADGPLAEVAPTLPRHHHHDSERPGRSHTPALEVRP
jgi:zinc transport system ATP-binding protein